MGCVQDMVRQAARDPLSRAFVALLAAPFRIWKPLLGFLFLLVIVLFVVGFGPAASPRTNGLSRRLGSGSPAHLVTLLVLLALAFRFLTKSA